MSATVGAGKAVAGESPPPVTGAQEPAAELRAAGADRPPRLARLLSGWRGFVILYVVFTGAYLGASGGRLRSHSMYNHYVYLADGWLHGRLALDGPPPNENDWAKVDVFKLKDGRELRGTYGSRTGGPTDRFYPLRGPSVTVPEADIASRSSIRYVSFPPFPAVLMAPLVAIWGMRFNDVLFTALWAGLNPALLFLLLGDLRRRGLSRRTVSDDLWLTAMFGVGSVYYYCAVIGQVWFTALIVGVTLSLGYAWAALDAERPVLAGICVGLGFATRGPWFVVPLFLCEAVRVSGGWPALRTRAGWRALAPRLVRFAVPVAAIGAALAWHNQARFGNPFEFGHRFLNVQWQERIGRFGLFNYHFLSRNLAAALVLLPRVMTRAPFVKISQHGMSLLVTSPNLAYTVMPQERNRLTKPLWLTIAAVAIPDLLYQSTGYIQFGYRFSLDYMIYFVVLLAIGNRRFTRLFKGLVVVAFAINLFLAITFDRYTEFTYDDSFFPNGNNWSGREGALRDAGRAADEPARAVSVGRRGSRRRCESRRRHRRGIRRSERCGIHRPVSRATRRPSRERGASRRPSREPGGSRRPSRRCRAPRAAATGSGTGAAAPAAAAPTARAWRAAPRAARGRRRAIAVAGPGHAAPARRRAASHRRRRSRARRPRQGSHATRPSRRPGASPSRGRG